MDTSKEYIEMCEKAMEIQERRPSFFNVKSYWSPAIPNIWLPRQDQLQGMLEHESYPYLTNFIEAFLAWVKTPAHHVVFLSMEQLWLAFVMRKKYGKVWNSKEWVDEA